MLRLSRGSRAGSQAGLKMAWVVRGSSPRFYYGWGGQGENSLLGAELVWFELLTEAKRGGPWASLSSCPDVVKGLRRGRSGTMKMSAIKHKARVRTQLWSWTFFLSFSVISCVLETVPLQSLGKGVFCAGHSLSITSVVVGPAFVVLIIITRCPPAITIRKLGGKKVYYLQDLEITKHIWGHTYTAVCSTLHKVWEIDGEREREVEEEGEREREWA